MVLFSGNWPSLSLFLLWGVVRCQFLRKGAGHYNLLWQVSPSGATIARVHVLSPTCSPVPTQSLEESPTGLCLYLRLFCLLPAVKKVPFYVKFSTSPLETNSNLIKIIYGKIIMRGSNGLFCYLSERNWILKRGLGTELEGTITFRGHFSCVGVLGYPNCWGMSLEGVMGESTHLTMDQWREILNVVPLIL